MAAKTKKGWSPLAIGATAVVVVGGGYLVYDQFFKKKPTASEPTNTLPDNTPNPTPSPTPTGGDLPDFTKWNINWPLAPPIDAAVIAKLSNGAETAFVVRLVQQRLMDLGYLKISATTGQFLDQTKQALIDFKAKTLNIPTSTPDIEKIGVSTMKTLFNNSYATYMTVYNELDTFYKSKGESIPSGFKGFGSPATVENTISTVKATNTYVKMPDGTSVALDKVDAGTMLGSPISEKNGWVAFKPFNIDRVLFVARWAIKYD